MSAITYRKTDATKTSRKRLLPGPGQLAFCLTGGAFIILLLRNPDISIEYMTRGLRLCVTSVIPTLFPFMVLSEILVRSGCGALLGRIFERPMRFLFGLGGQSASALLLGAVCGFPVGARCAATLYERGEISRGEAARVMTFCNYPSSAFMITAVGASLWSSRETGIALYASVLLAGAVCGIAGRFVFKKEDNYHSRHSAPVPPVRPPSVSLSAVAEAVTSAALSLLAVCAYVAFFSCIVGCISHILSGLPRSPFVNAAVYSFFELTSGAAAASALTDARVGAVLCAAAAGWSGLSVHLQIISIASSGERRIPIRPYLISKAVQALLAAFFMWLIILVFSPPLDAPSLVASVSAAVLPDLAILLPDGCFLISLTLLCCKKLDRHPHI